MIFNPEDGWHFPVVLINENALTGTQCARNVFVETTSGDMANRVNIHCFQHFQHGLHVDARGREQYVAKRVRKGVVFCIEV